VEVRLSDSGDTSHAGKTIAELFPEEAEDEPPTDFTPSPEMFAELRAKAALRDGYAFRLSAKSGLTFEGRTVPTDHGFGFNVVWNCHRPNRANLSLHAYTLDDLEQRKPMNDFAREYIEPPY
jgi:hypothetical protein